MGYYFKTGLLPLAWIAMTFRRKICLQKVVHFMPWYNFIEDLSNRSLQNQIAISVSLMV